MLKNENNHIYFPHIDGLRSLAVLSVMFYHAFPNLIPGGFIGVDIFFVISGYLITKILMTELELHQFSILKFYQRRAIRIFPALITVMIFSFILGYYVLVESEFKQLNKHIMAGVGFVSNIVLWFEDGYFDTISLTKPFLHLWSLGIEEQYYIFIPFILYFTWKNKINLLYTLFLLIALSFVFNIYTLYKDPTAAFYNPLGRSWELLAGSLLAYLSLNNMTKRLQNWYVALIGMALVVFPLFFYSKYIYFPGFAAVLPVIGTFLMIAAGTDNIIGKHILGNKFAVWLGLISYPLYLWHWSILSFLYIIHGGRSPAIDRASALLLTFVLAILTFYYIEKPAKKKPVLYPVILMVFLAFIGFLGYNGVIQQRIKAPGLEKLLTASFDFTYPITGMKPYGKSTYPFYTIPSQKTDTTLFLGDSSMEHFVPRIKKLIDDAPSEVNSVIFATRGGCLPIEGFDIHPRASFSNCPLVADEAYKLAMLPEVKKIVIGGNWFGQFSVSTSMRSLTDGKNTVVKTGTEITDESLARLGQSIARIARDKKVYLLTSTVQSSQFDPMTMLEGSRLKEVNVKPAPAPADLSEFMKTYAPIHEKLLKVARDNGAIIIDPIPAFCDKRQCPVMNEKGEPLYKDSLHIRSFTVIEKAQFLDITLK